MIDPFTIKPLDATTILASARATGGQIITVEDHYKEGGFIFYSVLLQGSPVICQRGLLTLILAKECTRGHKL